MANDRTMRRTFSCNCGIVSFEALGMPILSGMCYCDDCQAGSRQMEALGADSTCAADGGTHYLTWRDDRLKCLTGSDHLKGHKLRNNAPTERMLTTCCKTPMFLKFRWGHWTSTYAARYLGDIPALQMRTQTQFARPGVALPNDVPSYRTFPLALFGKLIAARFAMWLGA